MNDEIRELNTLDDRLKGRFVHVEVQLLSSPTGLETHEPYGARTQVYYGTYEGIQELGGNKMVVLEDAGYRRLSVDVPDNRDLEGTSYRRIKSDLTIIPLEQVLSISADKSKVVDADQ